MKMFTRFAAIAAAALFIFSVSGIAQKATPQPAKNPLVGQWVCDEDGTKVDIRADGTLTINGEVHAYKVKGSVITVIGDDGVMMIPFQLSGDTLVAEVEGNEMTYRRVKPGMRTASPGPAASGGIVQELVGKWCYMSNLTGTNSRMSSRCFVLNPDGTYEYSAETSSSGAIASSASQEYDSGRWTATRSSLTAISNRNGRVVYPIELRNHPKTGDPMIVVDGDAYVTAYQKRPW